MSNRERWIIYPLLFFALSLAARDRFVQPAVVEISRLSCKVIEAKSIRGEVMMAGKLTSDSIQAKELEADASILNSTDIGQLKCERLEARSADGQTLATLGANEEGSGQLAIYGSKEKRAVMLSCEVVGPPKVAHMSDVDLVLSVGSGGGKLVVVDDKDRLLGLWPVRFELVEFDEKSSEDPGGANAEEPAEPASGADD